MTESAKFDPKIVSKIKASLAAGNKVFITSGLLKALQGKGIEEIAEMECTGNSALIHDFINGFGAGNGNSLNDPKHDNPAVLFPEIRFLTNDTWGVIRGVAAAKGFPILLMNRYSKGIFYVINIPENMSDLYNLPQGVLTSLKGYLMGDFPVRIDSPAQVALFAYDNQSFVIESYKSEPCDVNVIFPGAGAKLTDSVSGKPLEPQLIPTPDPNNWWARVNPDAPMTHFSVQIQPHSYRVFTFEK